MTDERCVICGETIKPTELAEMHDPGMFDESFTEEERMVAAENGGGVVHAECGLAKGWVVS